MTRLKVLARMSSRAGRSHLAKTAIGEVVRFVAHQRHVNLPLLFSHAHTAFLRASSASSPAGAAKCSVPEHSATAFRSRGDAAAVEAACPGFIKAAMGVANTMEDKMRLLTYLELGRYTKPQLRHLYQQVLAALTGFPEGSPERATAMLNIQHIRMFLARRAYTPC